MPTSPHPHSPSPQSRRGNARRAGMSARAGLTAALALAVVIPAAASARDGYPQGYSATCGHLGVPCLEDAFRHGPKLRLNVQPRIVRSGSVARFRVRVTRSGGTASGPVARAVVRIAGRAVRTDRRGRAVLVTRVDGSGVHAVVARKSGARSAARTVRVVD